MDWRIPSWLWAEPEFRQGPRATNIEELLDLSSHTTEPDFRTIKARVQSHDHGMAYYNTQRYTTNNIGNGEYHEEENEPTFQQVYHTMWWAMFTPSPPIAQLIREQLETSGLVPGTYTGIHVRALYAVKDREPRMIEGWTQNAIRCASQLQPGGPYFLSSDSSYAVRVGRDYGQQQQHFSSVRIVSRSVIQQESNLNNNRHPQPPPPPEQPFHLDKAPRSARASDFYDTFVDLYLLALSRCVTYNMGGYGTWALLISPYANHAGAGAGPDGSTTVCAWQHHNASGIHPCEWVEPPIKTTTTTTTAMEIMNGTSPLRRSSESRDLPLFLPPMP